MPLPLLYADWSRLLSSHHSLPGKSLRISLDPNPKTLNCESNSIFFCSLLNNFFILCCSGSRHSSVIHFGAFSQLIFWLITVEKNKWMNIGWFHFFFSIIRNISVFLTLKNQNVCWEKGYMFSPTFNVKNSLLWRATPPVILYTWPVFTLLNWSEWYDSVCTEQEMELKQVFFSFMSNQNT